MSEKVEVIIFRSYIQHIPKSGNIFHGVKEDYILSFATEHYDSYGKGYGVFKPTWEVDSQSIEWVKKFKNDFPDTRVVISIGGFCSEFPFNPIEKNQWIENAVRSINQIIDLYGTPKNIIDGIDIHYEAIYSSEDDFSFCIGNVIRQLKHDQQLSIKIVSIAPTKLLQPYYHKLYLENNDIIDFVDYQFSKQSFSTKQQVVDLYKKLVVDYTPAFVLPEIIYNWDPILFDGINELFDLKLVPGMVNWGIPNPIETSKTFSLHKLQQNLRSNTSTS